MFIQMDAWPHRTHSFICNRLLPLGYLALLVGLALLPERSLYHKFFYALIAAPALLALAIKPATCKALLREPIVIGFLAFSAWSLISIGWSDTDASTSSLLKRPLYIFMLFAACSLMALQPHKRLEQCTLLAALLMTPVTLYCLSTFALDWQPEGRLVGTGALDNPLLSSHLFGFFCALWLGLAMTWPAPKNWIALLPLLATAVTLLATGSRTPLVAMALASAWLVLACWNKRAVMLLFAGICSLLALLLLYPEVLLNRGMSYRLDLWKDALEKISQQPWLGYGFDAPLAIYIDGFSVPFSEPHSFAIGVLYYTGLVGLSLWLTLHGLALSYCWRQRHNLLFIVCGALLVYGIGAGLAEGGGILARPKEHWFVTWIPLALIAALSIRNRQIQGTAN